MSNAPHNFYVYTLHGCMDAWMDAWRMDGYMDGCTCNVLYCVIWCAELSLSLYTSFTPFTMLPTATDMCQGNCYEAPAVIIQARVVCQQALFTWRFFACSTFILTWWLSSSTQTDVDTLLLRLQRSMKSASAIGARSVSRVLRWRRQRIEAAIGSYDVFALQAIRDWSTDLSRLAMCGKWLTDSVDSN